MKELKSVKKIIMGELNKIKNGLQVDRAIWNKKLKEYNKSTGKKQSTSHKKIKRLRKQAGMYLSDIDKSIDFLNSYFDKQKNRESDERAKNLRYSYIGEEKKSGELNDSKRENAFFTARIYLERAFPESKRMEKK